MELISFFEVAAITGMITMWVVWRIYMQKENAEYNKILNLAGQITDIKEDLRVRNELAKPSYIPGRPDPRAFARPATPPPPPPPKPQPKLEMTIHNSGPCRYCNGFGLSGSHCESCGASIPFRKLTLPSLI